MKWDYISLLLHASNIYVHGYVFYLFIFYYIKKLMVHNMIPYTIQKNRKTIHNTPYELTTMIICTCLKL